MPDIVTIEGVKQMGKRTMDYPPIGDIFGWEDGGLEGFGFGGGGIGSFFQDLLNLDDLKEIGTAAGVAGGAVVAAAYGIGQLKKTEFGQGAWGKWLVAAAPLALALVGGKAAMRWKPEVGYAIIGALGGIGIVNLLNAVLDLETPLATSLGALPRVSTDHFLASLGQLPSEIQLTGIRADEQRHLAAPVIAEEVFLSNAMEMEEDDGFVY